MQNAEMLVPGFQPVDVKQVLCLIHLLSSIVQQSWIQCLCFLWPLPMESTLDDAASHFC